MRRLLLTTTAMFMVLPGVAYAQAAAPEQPGNPAGDQTRPEEGLADIVVTAQRQPETQQRAAVAVDVIQGSDLRAAGITQAARLGELAPALSVANGGTGNIFFVRGVGNFTVSPNSDPAIAFNYDGVYIGRPSSTTGMFYDLERVEVLKGPQGTLYGRNATGGAINVLPVQPKIGGDLSGYASVSYGNFNALNAEGAINIPMGANGAARISATVSDHDGYRDDGTDDDKTWGLRFQMKANLTPSLTVRVAGDYSHTGGVGASAGYVGAYIYNPILGSYSLVPANRPDSEGFYSPGSQAYRLTVPAGTAGRRLDALSPYPYQNNDFYGVNAEISWDTGAGTLTVTPAWRYAHLNLLSDAAAFMYLQNETDEQFSVEARFTGKRVGPIDYTVGAYYFDESVNSVTALSLSSAASWLSSNYTTRSFAPFGRVTAHITDSLRLVGGLRYTKDRKTFDGPTISGAIVCTAIVAGVPTCPNAPLFPLVSDPSQLPFAFPPMGVPAVPAFAGGLPTGAIVARTDRYDNSRLTNQRVTYRAAIEYDVGPQSLFYASYETGYRSGGFSPAEGFETYQPEYLYAWTVGLKNRFFNNRVQLNLEGFWWDYKNQQVNHVGLDLNGRTANFTQNIGASRIKGVQVEGRFLATRNTLLSADIQYLDAKDISFEYQQAVGTPGTPPPLTGCAVTLDANPTLYDVNCAGKDAYNSPRWTINLAAQQTIPMGDYQFVIGADTQYKSSREIGFAYLPEQRAPAMWQSNAQIMFGPANDRWSIAAFVRNIENNRNPVFSATHPTTNILVVGTTAPRTYGLRLSGKF